MAKFRYVDPDTKNRDPFASEEKIKSDFEALLEADTEWVSSKRFKMGESVTGKILSVGQEFVFVDLGGKNAGALAIDEFRMGGAGIVPKVGDEVSAFVREDNGSEVILTRSLRRSETDDVMLRQAQEQQLPVEAKVEKVIKGGFEVSIGSKRGFVPMGNMDIVPIDNPESYVGNVLKFNIITYSGRNLVLSRKSLLREEQAEKVRELLSQLEVGQARRGTVTRLATFGAFVDIGGVEGLVPMGELSWTRVKNPEEAVKVGETVQVKITKIEHSPRLRIGLSIKTAGEDPWVAAATRMNPGEVLSGKVTRLADFGAFVSVLDGIEGLVHISQITWEKRLSHPSEMLKVGQEVSVHVLNVDIGEHKLSLSIKGPMPADMANRIDAKRRTQQSLSNEEQELVKEWENYQKMTKSEGKPSRPEDTSILAAAFSKARKR